MVHSVRAVAMENLVVPGVAAPELNHIFFPTRAVMQNVAFRRNVHRQKPLKIIMQKMKDVCDHMLRWMRLDMKNLAFDLAHGVGPCWKGQTMKGRWRWDNASADPASRIWPKPVNCDVMNNR